MANALYDKARELFLTGGLNMATDNIKCVLVDTATYTVNLGTDQFLSIIPGVELVATSANLSGKTVSAGVFDALDVVFATVAGDVAEALVIYKDTGVAATSPLIVYIDVAAGLPVVPNGGNITVTWDNGADKIFRL
jgi:hypothetical protein